MNSTGQQRRSACCWPAGYRERWAAEADPCGRETSPGE